MNEVVPADDGMVTIRWYVGFAIRQPSTFAQYCMQDVENSAFTSSLMIDLDPSEWSRNDATEV